jgi:hypothetical protein
MTIITLARSAFKDIANLHCNHLTHARKWCHATPAHPHGDTDPLFCYTSGRWLWNEREQLAARYRHFSISDLQQAACEAVGASKCTFLEKIGEGNYNKAYRLSMDDGQKVIAKIPHPNAGRRELTTASEVATMEFVRTVLGIPVPKVLAWSASDSNPVEAEYIIMEEASDSQLHEVWQDLSLWKKRDVIREIVDVERKLLSVSFDKYGLSHSTIAVAIIIAYIRGQNRISVFQRYRYCWMRAC